MSDSAFDEVQAAYDVAKAQLESATHQVEVAKAALDSARDSLDKTTIVAPLAGTVSKLNSRLGERVLGTVHNVGTEIMTIADLNEMEARVDIGEIDVVRIAPGQKARLEVDAFKNRKFNGTVTEIANSSKDAGQMGAGCQPGGHQVRGAHPHPGKGSVPAGHVGDRRDRNPLPHQRADRAVRQRHHPAAQGNRRRRATRKARP